MTSLLRAAAPGVRGLRPSLLRGVAVVAITASVTVAAACSDEDVVDTIPPPRPNATQSDGPAVGPPSTSTSVTTSRTTTSHTSSTGGTSAGR